MEEHGRCEDDRVKAVEEAAVPWDQVESVMVCLRMRSDQSNYQGVATTGCQNEAIAADGRVRRVFFRVFNIRNVGV